MERLLDVLRERLEEMETLMTLNEAYAEGRRGEGQPMEEALPALRERLGMGVATPETRSMIFHKGYTRVFEYEPESEMFSGNVIDLREQIYFEGTSTAELKQSMARAVDHYLEVCRMRNEEPNGPR